MNADTGCPHFSENSFKTFLRPSLRKFANAPITVRIWNAKLKTYVWCSLFSLFRIGSISGVIQLTGMEKCGNPVAWDNQEILLGNQSRNFGCPVDNSVCKRFVHS